MSMPYAFFYLQLHPIVFTFVILLFLTRFYMLLWNNLCWWLIATPNLIISILQHPFRLSVIIPHHKKTSNYLKPFIEFVSLCVYIYITLISVKKRAKHYIVLFNYLYHVTVAYASTILDLIVFMFKLAHCILLTNKLLTKT